MLELDVRMTRDRQVVVFHDQTLARVTGRDLQVAEVDYEALPTLDPKIPIDTIPGKKFYYFNMLTGVLKPNCNQIIFRRVFL